MREAVFPSLMRRHLEPHALDTLAHGEREVVRVAGFYADGFQAQRAWQRLQDAHGLSESDLLLLRPEDGVSARFRKVARHWVARRGQRLLLSRSARRQAALCGGAACGGLAWLWMSAYSDVTVADLALATLSAAGIGLLMGRRLLALAVRHGPFHRFDRRVQHQLNAGGHALVVLEVPSARQADVLGLVRGSSRGWCAEVPRTEPT